MQDEMTAQIVLTLFSGGVSTLCAYLLYCLKEREKEREKAGEKRRAAWRAEEEARARKAKALEEGLCALLRDRIVQSAIFFQGRGHASAAQKDNVNKMYQSYHALGGNGTATHALEEIMSLPFEPERR